MFRPIKYFDIETNFKGQYPNPKQDEIITVQTKQIYPESKPLEIFAVWKDQDVMYEFSKIMLDESFVITGANLNFEFAFFKEQVDYNFDPYYRKHLDIKDILIFFNNLEFEQWNRFLNKENFSEKIPFLYKKKEYQPIITYIEKEALNFEILFNQIRKKLEDLS